MKRFIVTAYNLENEKDVFVVHARSEYKAYKKALIKAVERGSMGVATMRKLYNPKYDPITGWLHIDEAIPEKDMQQYKYWDKKYGKYLNLT
jgi:hypothetical protein